MIKGNNMKYKIINLLLSLGLMTSSCLATETNPSLHGFGTLGIAYQDNDEVLYRNSLNTKEGTQGDFSFANYSSFGLQLDLQVGEKISLTAQGIASENNSNAKLLELSWLNAKYKFNDNTSIRIGKMRIPTFMYSDILNVSYSYDWIRLPDMYSILPFNNYTGVELNHDIDFNDITIMSTALYGEAESDIYSTSSNNQIFKNTLTANKLYALKFKLLYDNLTLRAGYSDYRVTFLNKEVNTALSGLNALGVPLISQEINKYNIDNASGKYLNIGAKYDFKHSYLVAEYMEANNDSFLADNRSWYVGTGYNFENWSPYILYSNVNSRKDYKNIQINNDMSPETVGAINMSNYVLSSISKEVIAIKLDTISIGLRYNLSENSLLKLQYDRQKEKKDNRLNFRFSEKQSVSLDVFSAAISFVF